VHLAYTYPNPKADLGRSMPLVKWFLAIPHYIALFFLSIGALFAVSSPGSRSCSPVDTHVGSSITSMACCAGTTASSAMRSRWSPTAIRRFG
jgi:hypothetical protein